MDSQGVQVTVWVGMCCALWLHNHVNGRTQVEATLLTLVMEIDPDHQGEQVRCSRQCRVRVAGSSVNSGLVHGDRRRHMETFTNVQVPALVSSETPHCLSMDWSCRDGAPWS